MKVTRTFKTKPDTETLASLQVMARILTPLRKEIWHRYGGLKTQGASRFVLAKEVRSLDFYKNVKISGQVKADVVNDTLSNIFAYKEASKFKVKQDIAKRTKDNEERKRLFTLLKSDKWLDDNFLSRRMRKHFKHGKSKLDNQILFDPRAVTVTPDKIVFNAVNKYHGKIEISIKQNGVLPNLIANKNIRVILKDGCAHLNYAIDKPEGRPCGDNKIGVDKGYTEAFADSEGEFYATDFGKLTSAFSDKNKGKGKSRSRLWALEQKHISKGNFKKANNIRKFNLGKKTLDTRKKRVQNQLKDRVYKSVHKMVDKANLIVSEDLSSPIKSRTKFKNMNRRLSNWYKGLLANAVEEITTQRGCKHSLINPAYTSQMDSRTGFLEGKRVGDKFYHAEHGVVSQADYNASRNILARNGDKEITLYMPYRKVKEILLARKQKRDANTFILDFSCSGIFPLSTKNELTNNANYFCGFGGIS